MKRVAFKPRTKPMDTTGALRVASASKTKLARPMKSSKPKMTAIRKSAKNKDCTFRIVGVCNWNPETTVWCHSNESVDGKGAGLKARDVEGAYGCSACHEYYDGGYVRYGIDRETVRMQFNIARIRSWSFLEILGLLK